MAALGGRFGCSPTLDDQITYEDGKGDQCNWDHDLVCGHPNTPVPGLRHGDEIGVNAIGPASGGLSMSVGSVGLGSICVAFMSDGARSALPGGRSGRARSRQMGDNTVPADSSRPPKRQPASARPNPPAFSAYLPFGAGSSILSSPKQEDLKWLTMIFQNRHPIGPIVFRSTVDQGLAGLALSLRGSSSCWLFFMPSLAGRACRHPRIQARSWRQRPQHQPMRHRWRANNVTVFPNNAAGRGLTLAPAHIGHAATQPDVSDRWTPFHPVSPTNLTSRHGHTGTVARSRGWRPAPWGCGSLRSSLSSSSPASPSAAPGSILTVRSSTPISNGGAASAQEVC